MTIILQFNFIPLFSGDFCLHSEDVRQSLLQHGECWKFWAETEVTEGSSSVFDVWYKFMANIGTIESVLDDHIRTNKIYILNSFI